jgi:acetyl-CoA synthetase (ADP-forming)
MSPKQIFESVRKKKRKNLTELESREILEYYKLPLVRGKLIKSIEESKRFIDEVGYPVVLKVVSPEIIHKTEVGGVIINIQNDKQLYEAYNDILKNVKAKIPTARIDGLFIQEMIPSSFEVMVGGKYDNTFGQTIAFGLGGIYVEVYEDVSFRIVPITEKDALNMIKETKVYKILSGYRGKKSADIKALIDILMKTSKMLESNPEIKELDMNPVFALQDRAVAIDARIIIE